MSVSYTILYGYDKKTFLQYASQENSNIIVLEPRSLQIDLFNKEKSEFKNYKFIPKALHTQYKSVLYKNRDVYWMDKKQEEYTKREEIFCIKFSDLIEQENIQNIDTIVFNLPIQNLNETLSDFDDYSHIVSKISLSKGAVFKITTSFIEKQADTDFLHYENKNIDIELPRICLYTLNPNVKHQKEFIKMLKQYDMDFMTNEDDEKIITDVSSIDFSKFSTYTKYTINEIPEKLIKIFKKDYYDIIIQFNDAYFTQKRNFQLLYPTNDNTLYIKKESDIIYGTGKCMFKLYKTMCSEEYKEHMNKKREERPKLFKLFEKRYFYEYLPTIFQIIEVK